ncbi:MAG: tRNA (adenosine(37)-N6)-threonylcarbamoyltransferase complex dimerization subunit type 1 TsaB [Proteobacteria bacterium]|nr:tRNA (adenosine(37)-N6)-threonylcarbamoyltransferase complex dimerization subunit type 1 TsaB [Pseudomonadota bacterium]
MEKRDLSKKRKKRRLVWHNASKTVALLARFEKENSETIVLKRPGNQMKVGDQCILGIDGSGFAISVGVLENRVPKGMIYLNDGSPGSEVLLATIDQLLTTLKMEQSDLDGICVTLGPGSFTSLRISLAVAESIGLGLNLPVYGVDTLQIIAGSLPFYPGQIKVIQNAYKGEFYTATYKTDNGKPVLQDSLQLIKPDAFYEGLIAGDMILGTGLATMFKKGFDLAAKNVNWNQDFHRNVSGISVIEHFLEHEVQEPSVKPLEPIYIRLSEAEINYEKQFGIKK